MSRDRDNLAILGARERPALPNDSPTRLAANTKSSEAAGSLDPGDLLRDWSMISSS
jgi:hypothetical protein